MNTSEDSPRNIKLGAFIIAGSVLLILALYLIGNRQNLFGSTFTLQVRFHNVNGLMKGNNVRFAGIDVGTVKSVRIENDSTVIVSLLVEKSVQPFVNRNAIASVGTDGLMGNKLVNINVPPGPGARVKDGDVLESLRPLEMDEMMRTLGATNDNMRVVTQNLRVITDNISKRNSFWHLLSDSSLSDDIRNTVTAIRISAYQTSSVTMNARVISERIRSGEGIGALLSDSVTPLNIRHAALQLARTSDSARVAAAGLSSIINSIRSGQGSAGKILYDTTLIHNMNSALLNIDSGAANFNRNMKAMRKTWPFRKGFKEKK